MVHQGKILKKQIENKDMNQTQAAAVLNLSRSGLTLLFKEVELPKKHLDNAINLLGIPKEVFFPVTTQSQPTAPVEVGCWQQLAEARQHIIMLQQQIIEMSKPNINAPVVRTQGQPV